MQDCSNSSALAMKLLQSCTEPSMSCWTMLQHSNILCSTIVDMKQYTVSWHITTLKQSVLYYCHYQTLYNIVLFIRPYHNIETVYILSLSLSTTIQYCVVYQAKSQQRNSLYYSITVTIKHYTILCCISGHVTTLKQSRHSQHLMQESPYSESPTQSGFREIA